ncbi:MAG: hypothetical protein KJ000_34855 [Pirellulaceae bacterium]|nr:hypothetical protein [Pirellulaceae bacterium]
MNAIRLATWLPVAALLVSGAFAQDGTTVKRVLRAERAGENLLRSDGWRAWSEGFQRQGDHFLCDNGDDARVQRGAGQTVVLNQRVAAPIVATAWSRAEGVTGSPGSDYSLYLDLVYDDGTPLWGQSAAYDVGTHDWQRRQVVVLPEKPVRQLTVYLLLRNHAGKAWFRDPELRIVEAPDGAALFDGVPVIREAAPSGGFQVRDVAAGSDFVRIERAALGLRLDGSVGDRPPATDFEYTLTDTTGRDRAVTLLYAVPVPRDGLSWLADPRRSEVVETPREYVNASSFRAGANGRLSRYPLGAVASANRGIALGLDMARPAFYRIGYNAATEELFLAYDIALTPEKPAAHIRFRVFSFDPAWGFRAALDRYYALFPEAFACRVREQGLWMPFAPISRVAGWQDFGFRFKEGNDETAWDDQHGILTFRYTEPMTWWMAMPPDMPRTIDAALAEAKRLADEKGDRRAMALLNSGYHNAAGQFSARLLDTPWCNGAVWSVNSMPGVSGEATDFKNKWDNAIRDRWYGPRAAGTLDGEYVDSSEGYVTDELNFRRDHFAAAETPLTFSLDTRQPAIFRGLIAFEYVRALARDMHGSGRLMMANSTPGRLCWLAPLLDVLGTETNWHPGRWSPMSDAELLYRRAMCKGKPYCFLMNTQFEDFSTELVERYMQRSLAYGMFPGFFSHNASEGHYFKRPELYERDRPLFRKYVPLCRQVAEAGWKPVTLARCDNPEVYIERFGPRLLTVFNDSSETQTARIRLESKAPKTVRELLTNQTWEVQDAVISATIESEGVRVLEFDADLGTQDRRMED